MCDNSKPESTASSTDQPVKKSGLRKLITLFALLFIVAGGYLAYANLISPLPKEKPAELYTRATLGDDADEFVQFKNPDGTIDFASYIEAKRSAGVTPEDNALPDIARALDEEFLPRQTTIEKNLKAIANLIDKDPGIIELLKTYSSDKKLVEKALKTWQKKAGIKPGLKHAKIHCEITWKGVKDFAPDKPVKNPKIDYKKFATLYDAIAQHRKLTPAETKQVKTQLALIFIKEHDSAEPLTDEDGLNENTFYDYDESVKPVNAYIVYSNQRSLDQLVQASKKSKFYLPIMSLRKNRRLSNGFGISLTYLQYLLSDLISRAKIKAYHNAADSALDDLQAAIRIADFFRSNYMSTIAQVYGIEFKLSALNTAAEIAGRCKLSQAQLNRLGKMVEQKDSEYLFTSMENYNYLEQLDLVMLLRASMKISDISGNGVKLGIPETARLYSDHYYYVDWIALMKRLTKIHQQNLKYIWSDGQLGKPAAEIDYNKAEKNLDQAIKYCDSNSGDILYYLLPRKYKSDRLTQTIGDYILANTYPYPKHVIRKKTKTAAMNQLAATAVQIAKFKLKYNRYPKTLRELIPEFAKAIPEDPFTKNDPLKYVSDGKHFKLWSIDEVENEEHANADGDINSDFTVSSLDHPEMVKYLTEERETHAEFENNEQERKKAEAEREKYYDEMKKEREAEDSAAK